MCRNEEEWIAACIVMKHEYIMFPRFMSLKFNSRGGGVLQQFIIQVIKHTFKQRTKERKLCKRRKSRFSGLYKVKNDSLMNKRCRPPSKAILLAFINPPPQLQIFQRW